MLPVPSFIFPKLPMVSSQMDMRARGTFVQQFVRYCT